MSHIKKNMLSFFLTTKCNLDCSYCYTNKNTHKHQSIQLNFAKLGVDTFLGVNDIKHIRFFGAGEPTVEFQLLQDICKYADKNAPFKVTKELQTNGVFSDYKAQWLAANFNIIWVSCDGTPRIQNYFRRTVNGEPTSDLLEKNIRYLTSHGSGMTGVRSTITNVNVLEQCKMIKYFHGLGVKYVWSDPLFPTVGSLHPIDSLDLMVYVKKFIEAAEYAESLGMVYRTFLACNFDEKVEYHCRACLPAPHLTTDGYISACDMALFGSDDNHMSNFIYGKWDKENNLITFNKEKINLLRSRNIDSMPTCNQCEIKQNCGGYCLGEVTNETFDLFGRKAQVCEPIKYLAKHIKRNTGCYKYLHP